MSDKSLIDGALEKGGLQSSTAPQELSGVKTFNTEEDTPLEIIKSYHEKEFVKCSCGINKAHKQGIVVRFDNGNHGLMGLNCARRDFGDETVNNLESSFAAKKRTLINKSFIVPTLTKIQEDRVFIAQVMDQAKKKDQFFNIFSNLANGIYSKLEMSVEQDYGRWTREVYTKRTAIDRNGKEKTVTEAQKVTVFVIDGYKAIARNCTSTLNNASRLLDRAEHFIKIEPYEDKNIETARRCLGDAEQKLNDVREGLEATKRFFTPQNLEALCQAVEKDNTFHTELVLTKRKLRLPTDDWEKSFEYIDIPYDLAGLSDDGTTKAVA